MPESPLRYLDTTAVSRVAAKEVYARERTLPPISTFRWWARRTAAVTGGVLDAYARVRPGDALVCDPFAGGGTVALESVRRGHRVHAQDIDPWATLGIAACLSIPDKSALTEARRGLYEALSPHLARAYRTTFADGKPAQLAHTFRVAVGDCPTCDNDARLYPYATVTHTHRGVRVGSSPSWLACRAGHLHLATSGGRSSCPECGRDVEPGEVYAVRRRVACPSCQTSHPLSAWAAGSGLRWEVVLVERSDGIRREFATPTQVELHRSEDGWQRGRILGPIRRGPETRHLIRHGFLDWDDLYPPRQHELLAAALEVVPDIACGDEALERAMRVMVAGAAEMAGYLSRWDRRYLKSYEAMAGHRFNLTTFAAESHIWGIGRRVRGSISRRFASLQRAALWYRDEGLSVQVEGPLARHRQSAPKTGVRIVRGSSTSIPLPDAAVDLIWTDPPYHDNLAYHDLSAPLRAWASLGCAAIRESVAVHGDDEKYEKLLCLIFAECRRVLRPEGRMLLTFANRDPVAWISLFRALRQGGFFAHGYAIVRSDAPADCAKTETGSSQLDMVLDLAPYAPPDDANLHRPAARGKNGEARFLDRIGELFLLAVAKSPPLAWSKELAELPADVGW